MSQPFCVSVHMLSNKYDYKPFRFVLVVDFTLKYVAENKSKGANHSINKLFSTNKPLKKELKMCLYY